MNWKRVSGWVVVLVVLLGAAAGARPAYRMFKEWRAGQFAEEGEEWLRRENWEQARQRLEAALQLQPAHEGALRALARLYSRFGRTEGLEYWKALLAGPNGTTQDREEFVSLAMRLGRLDLARGKLSELLAPASANTLLLAAQYYQIQGDLARAAQFARSARERGSTNDFTQLLLGNLLLASADAKERAEGRQLLWTLGGGAGKYRVNALRLLASSPDLAGAERLELIQRLRENRDGHPADQFLASDLAIQLEPGRRQEIIAETIRQFQSGTDEELAALGQWLNQHGRFAETLEVVAADRAQAEGRLLIVRLDALAGLDRWDTVQAQLSRERLPIEPVVAECYRAHAASRLAIGSDDRRGATERLADVHWRQAHSLAGEHPDKLLFLAEYAERMGARAEALRAHRKLVELPAYAVHACRNLIRLTEQSEDLRALREWVRKLTALMPDDPAPRNDLAYLNLLLGEEIEASRKSAEQLVAANPEVPAYRVTLALACLRARDYTRARAQLDREMEWRRAPPAWQAIYAAVMGASDQAELARQTARQVPADRLKAEEYELIRPWL